MWRAVLSHRTNASGLTNQSGQKRPYVWLECLSFPVLTTAMVADWICRSPVTETYGAYEKLYRRVLGVLRVM